MILRSLTAPLMTLLVASCTIAEKPPLEPPLIAGDSSADGFFDDVSIVADIECGESREDVFRGETFLAYLLEGVRGQLVTVDVQALSDGADPVLFVYGPASDDDSDPVLIARNDEQITARRLSAILLSRGRFVCAPPCPIGRHINSLCCLCPLWPKELRNETCHPPPNLLQPYYHGSRRLVAATPLLSPYLES